MKYIYLQCSLGILSMLMISCADTMVATEHSVVKTYLHLSHTRSPNNIYLDSLVQTVDYEQYDMLLLGGDLTYLTSESDSSMMHVDSIFDLSNPNTLWSLGNHDHTNLPNITKYTDRPLYYTYHQNGITIIVLNTEEDLCIIDGDQKALFDSVIDTLQNSSHLLILHHKLIWLVDNSELQSEIPEVSNGEYGDCHYCLNPNNFYEDIYPRLVEIQEKGIQVICLGGDIGTKVKQYQYVTEEEVQFLASGIYSGHDDNQALEFTHDITNGRLSWQYIHLDDLPQ